MGLFEPKKKKHNSSPFKSARPPPSKPQPRGCSRASPPRRLSLPPRRASACRSGEVRRPSSKRRRPAPSLGARFRKAVSCFAQPPSEGVSRRPDRFLAFGKKMPLIAKKFLPFSHNFHFSPSPPPSPHHQPPHSPFPPPLLFNNQTTLSTNHAFSSPRPARARRPLGRLPRARRVVPQPAGRRRRRRRLRGGGAPRRRPPPSAEGATSGAGACRRRETAATATATAATAAAPRTGRAS